MGRFVLLSNVSCSARILRGVGPAPCHFNPYLDGIAGRGIRAKVKARRAAVRLIHADRHEGCIECNGVCFFRQCALIRLHSFASIRDKFKNDCRVPRGLTPSYRCGGPTGGGVRPVAGNPMTTAIEVPRDQGSTSAAVARQGARWVGKRPGLLACAVSAIHDRTCKVGPGNTCDYEATTRWSLTILTSPSVLTRVVNSTAGWLSPRARQFVFLSTFWDGPFSFRTSTLCRFVSDRNPAWAGGALTRRSGQRRVRTSS